MSRPTWPRGYGDEVLLAAALVPQTLLLVPGASGRTAVLEEVRAAALAAASSLGETARAGARLVVVAPGSAGSTTALHPGCRVAELARASHHGAGVRERFLGWAPAAAPRAAVPRGLGAPVVAAARLLGAAGGPDTVDLVTVAPTGEHGDGGAAARAVGAGLLSGPDDIALLVVGSLGVRGTEDGAWAHEPGAGEVDARLLDLLVRADDGALAEIATFPQERAAHLGIGAWGPLQVAVGAARARTERPDPGTAGHLLALDVTLGARHAVLVWPSR